MSAKIIPFPGCEIPVPEPQPELSFDDYRADVEQRLADGLSAVEQATDEQWPEALDALVDLISAIRLGDG